MSHDKALELVSHSARHFFRMRRALTLLLLAVLSFPLITSVLLAISAPPLPSCCRRNGSHHCAMLDIAEQRESPAGEVMKARQPRCPLYPTAGVVPAYASSGVLGAAPRVGPPLLSCLKIPRPEGRCSSIALRNSVPQRGPPLSPSQTNPISL